MTTKQKIDVETRKSIVKALDEGLSIHAAAAKFEVSKGTVQYAKKQRNKLHEAEEIELTCIVKSHPVDEYVWQWFQLVRSNGFVVSGNLVKIKALELFEKMSLPVPF